MGKPKRRFQAIKTRCFCLFLFLSFLFPLTAWPQEKILRVGVAPGEPFVVVVANQYQGIAVDIWKILAKNLNIKYVFVPMGEHIDDDIKLLADGKIDVLIGPIIPTKDRAELVDFTRPYYLDQIGLVVPIKKIPFFRTLNQVLMSSFSWMLALFLALFVLYIHVFWFFERKKHYMDVQRDYRLGIKTAFWLHTLGISFNRIPTHPRTRVFRFIWSLALILLLSTISATITSSLTVALSNNYVKYEKLSDFSENTIAAVVGTAPYDIADEVGLNIVPAQNREEAINLLLQGKVAGFADYYPIADYYLRKHRLKERLTMADAIIAQNTFAFALPIDSPLRHSLDLQLDIIQSNGQVRFLCESVLGEKAAKNCEI